MELVSALIIVFFFVILNELRVAFVGKDNLISEIFILTSSIIAGVFFAALA